MRCNVGPGPGAAQLLGSGDPKPGERRKVWFVTAGFPGSAPLGMSALLPPLPHSWVSSWPRGALEFLVLPGPFGLCKCPSSLQLQAFGVLGQDFLVCGSRAKAAAASPSGRRVKIPKQQPKAVNNVWNWGKGLSSPGVKWQSCPAGPAELSWVHRGAGGDQGQGHSDTVTCWELCLHVSWLCSLFRASSPILESPVTWAGWGQALGARKDNGKRL